MCNKKIGSFYKEVELFSDPADDIRKRLPEEMQYAFGDEMTDWQLSFLCGLIKEHKPKKIVEVGAAAGKSASVILNCLHMLGLNSEVFSVDVAKQWYYDNSKEVGFMSKYVSQLLNYEKFNLLTGDIVAHYLNEIGENIDFLLLDTMHTLPGEILDFLVCLPYLAPNAVVVLHDVVLNNHKGYSDCFATKILFDAVSADKYYMLSDDEQLGLSNIAAFQINETTYANISEVFSALTVSWPVCPNDYKIQKYSNIIKQKYNESLVEFFEKIIRPQIYISKRKIARNKYLEFTKNKKVIFYGGGRKCIDILHNFDELELDYPDVIWDIWAEHKPRLFGLDVVTPNYASLKGREEDIVCVITIVDKSISEYVKQKFIESGISNILDNKDMEIFCENLYY